MSNATIDRLEEQRQAQLDFVEQTLSKVDEEGRDLVDAEKRNLETARDRVKELDEQLKPLREFEELRSAHRSGGNVRPAGGTKPGEAKSLSAQTEARGYDYSSPGEFFADAFRANVEKDTDAAARLASVGRGVQDGKLTVLDPATARSVDQAQYTSLSAEQRASAPNVTTVEIPGILPVSIVGSLVNDIDASRPFLQSIGVKDLGGVKGKTFTRPVVTEHVQMGTQSAEKTALQAGQFKVDDIDFTKSTEGGYVNVSRQSIDWSSPAMWNVLLADFLDIYARHTENKAADAFVAAVQAGTAAVPTTGGTTPTLDNFIKSLYAGASAVYTATGRLPDHLWVSFDRWALVAEAQDKLAASSAGNGGGSSSIQNMQAGSMLGLPRTVVPSFPAGTVILGLRDRVEAYEERLGFLSAVEPKILGIELAYAGYFASGLLAPAAFAELTYTA